MDMIKPAAVYHRTRSMMLVFSMTKLKSLLLVLSLIAPFLVVASMIVGVLISVI